MQATDDQGFQEDEQPAHDLARIQRIDDELAGIVANLFSEAELKTATPAVFVRIRRGE